MKLYIILLLTLIACSKEDHHSKYLQRMADEECFLVVNVPPRDNSVWFVVKGYDPITHESKVCKTHNRWWNLFANEMEFGDTLVKKKGELIFEIRKKDTIIYHDRRTIAEKL
ncbi:hypothetical protein [Chryseobacterium geocarposphaerae]|uniref:Uncharacterized protein n=1 Tax=Chryseobacterium geocarposphaerae TaxID=1416776 RepID=A0A2M9BXV3_9FLAO|nr:hypothetical protein [Chryseobacterium geocarposphaerae]PJJ62909.1 hypothetical protein CLV73_3422 [Chryseobacterium geocarposphaerae]